MAENRRMTVTRRQSIAHIDIRVDASLARDDWMITIQIEEAFYDDAGALVPGTQRSTRTVRRRWAELKDDPQIGALHSMMRRKIYEWLAVDAAKPSMEDIVRKHNEQRLQQEGTP